MKRITIEIEDDLYRDLKQAVLVSALGGSLFGLKDEFVAALVRKLETDTETWHPAYKPK